MGDNKLNEHTRLKSSAIYYTCNCTGLLQGACSCSVQVATSLVYSLPLTVCTELSKNRTIRPHGDHAVHEGVLSTRPQGARAARAKSLVWGGDEARLRTLFNSNRAHMQQQLATLEISPAWT